MIIRDIKISSFRNLANIHQPFDNGIYYIFSPNGTGKTNFLEAMQLLTIGKSLRAQSENNLFNFAAKSNKIDVIGEFSDEDGIIFKQEVALSKSPQKKRVLTRNNNKLSINEYVGKTPSIWFSPESIKIISSSPQNKRKYFDNIMTQLSSEYGYNLRAYNRSLRQRNKVLQTENPSPQQIRIWTENLINYGCKVIKYKNEFFSLVNEEFGKLQDFPRYKFQIKHIPNIELDNIFDEDCEYKFKSELQHSYKKDMILQNTTVGPHRDDWDLEIKLLPSRKFISTEKYASRGQQRMSLIILQIVLINIFFRTKKTAPILLLDDIFSELDKENEEILIKFIKEKQIQTFITGVGKLKSKGLKQINLQSL